MTQQKVRIGELLVDAGVLTPEKLQEALELQKGSGLRLGSVLIQSGLVTEPQLVQALSKQLSIPWVSLWHLDISEQLLDMIPEEIVVENGILPIYIRSLRDGGKALYVAMDNPADAELLETIASSCGLTVKPMIAGPSEIGAAIHNYYGRRWRGAPMPTEKRLSSVPPPGPARDETEEEPEEILLEEEVPAPAAEAPPAEPERQPPAQGEIDGEPIELTQTVDEDDQEQPGAEQPGAEEEPDAPAPAPAPAADLFAPRDEPAPARGRKFKRWRPGKVSLTFLDGTSVALGAQDKAAGKPERSTEEILEQIGKLDLSTGEGRKLALVIKGILETLLRRGMLTDAELSEMVKDD